MAHSFFPVISGAALVSGGDTDAKAEPGCVQMYRYSDGQYCMAQYVRNGNVTAINAGICCMPNNATLMQYGVRAALTTDGRQPIAGIALATIASQKYGWIAIRGYVGSAYTVNVGTAFCPLFLSTVTAGYLGDIPSAVYYTAGVATDTGGTLAAPIALARDTAAGLASISLIGCWGV